MVELNAASQRDQGSEFYHFIPVPMAVPAVDSVVVSAVVSTSEANRSFSSLLRQMAPGQDTEATRATSHRALLIGLAKHPAAGEPRRWSRDELHD